MTTTWKLPPLACLTKSVIVSSYKVFSITSMLHRSTPSMESFSTSRCMSSTVLLQTAKSQPNSPMVFLDSSSRLFQIILSSPCTVWQTIMTDSWRGCSLNQWAKRKRVSPRSHSTFRNSSKNWGTTEDGLTLDLWLRLHSLRVSYGTFWNTLSHSVSLHLTCSSTTDELSKKESSTRLKMSNKKGKYRLNSLSSLIKWSHSPQNKVKPTLESQPVTELCKIREIGQCTTSIVITAEFVLFVLLKY